MNTLLTSVLVASLGQPAPGPEPVLAALGCPTPSIAVGEIKGGQPLSRSFQLVHKGTGGEIFIRGIEVGCGCVRRALSAESLKPGATATLTLEINTLTQRDGPNRWQAVIAYDQAADKPADPMKPGVLMVEITGSLSRDVLVNPAQVAFSTTGEAAQTITLTDRRPKPLKIVRAASSSPALSVEISPPTADGQAIHLKLAAAAPVGKSDEIVSLITDDPAYPELRVPVRVEKRGSGGATPTPDRLDLRFAAGQAEVSGLVQIRGMCAGNVSIAAATCDQPGVSVKWSPGSGPVGVVRVTVPSTAGVPGGTSVRVRLTEPQAQELVIPVSWSGKVTP